MRRNSVLLSVGAALVLSLFLFDVSHAVQIDRAKQFPPTRTGKMVNSIANAPVTQVASAPIPCRGDGMRRTGAPCTTQTQPGAAATSVTPYTTIAITVLSIFVMAFALLSVSLFRRTHQPPFINSTH